MNFYLRRRLVCAFQRLSLIIYLDDHLWRKISLADARRRCQILFVTQFYRDIAVVCGHKSIGVYPLSYITDQFFQFFFVHIFHPF